MVDCMREEIKMSSYYLEGKQIETIYFGGGTPSLLENTLLEELLIEIGQYHNVNSNAEISIECNPDDITPGTLIDYDSLGVNRISLGVQTFDNAMLKFLNRLHDRAKAIESLENINDGPIKNYSLDLIYALPSDETGLLENDLSIAMKFEPPHISAYCLTIEEKTAFGKWVKEGKMHPVEEDFSADQYDLLMTYLEKAGYQQYEISNFSRPGFESRHNKGYWEHKEFLGIGPGAYSFNGDSRRFNVKNNVSYIRSINERKIPYEVIVMKRDELINEYILTSLRTQSGCDLNYLKKKYKYDLMNSSEDLIRLYDKNGFLSFSENLIQLKKKGKFLADKIASDLFMHAG